MPLERDLVAACLAVANAMGVYVEPIGQRKAKGSGTAIGAPDLLVYAGGTCLPCELKRAKHPDGTPAGKLSLGQIVSMERRQEHGVETAVVTSVDEFVRVVNKLRVGRGVRRRA